MRRGSRFLIGLAAAALTYGSLVAFVGPRHFGHYGFYHYQAYRGNGPYHCDGRGDGNWHRHGERPKQPGTGQTDTINHNQE